VRRISVKPLKGRPEAAGHTLMTRAALSRTRPPS